MERWRRVEEEVMRQEIMRKEQEIERINKEILEREGGIKPEK